MEKAKACDVIWDEYKEAVENCDEGQCESIEGLASRHHYASKSGSEDVSGEPIKAILKEIKKDLPRNMELSSRAAMFLRYDEDKPQFIQACLTGVQDTPYSSGVFVFDIYIPSTYPQQNCLVTHTSRNASMVAANNGPGGFSPNLHRDSGKVCLSLLGTWDGPGWEAGTSNVYQVLSTILWCILGAEHPYYMEPGFGGWEGTAPTEGHTEEVIEYDEEVYFGTAKWAILEMLKQPPEGFEEVVRAHFRTKRRIVLDTIRTWAKTGSEDLKEKLKPVLIELEHELSKLMTVEECKAELEEALLEVDFIVEKMKYLEGKILACRQAGKDPKQHIPKAYRRLRMGPKLLEQAQKSVKEKQEQLRRAESQCVAGAVQTAMDTTEGTVDEMEDVP